jgi:ABC-type ATPase involved in cell division
VIWLEEVNCKRAARLVLSNVTLGVAEGELVVIQGPAASGKTTLLGVAAMAIAPDSGRLWFANKNISTLQKASLPFVRRNIGYHTPSSLLIESDTVMENLLLALALRGESRRGAETAALHALDLLDAVPIADRLVSSLSTGQRRQVTLARALAGPPPLMVVDEPAVGMSSEGRRALVRAFNWARTQKAAVLCATADETLAEDLARAGGRKVLLENGRIVGTPPIGLVPAIERHIIPLEKLLARVDETFVPLPINKESA